MSYQKDRDEFIGVIVVECNAQRHAQEQGTVTTYADAVDFARLILRNAATLQHLAVLDCNRGGLTDGDVARKVQCERRIAETCTPWGIKPSFNDDPRGACVKLHLSSGRWNSWGGKEDGYCVPTR